MNALTANDRLEFGPPPIPGSLRSFALAVLAHAFLVAALTWGVHWRNDSVTVMAEAELWSAVPQQAAPKLVEVAPEPPPPPPAPVVEAPKPAEVDIALEREKLRLKKEKLDQLALEKQRLKNEKIERDKLRVKAEKLALEKKRLQDKQAALEKQKLAQEKQRKDAQQAQQDAKRLDGLRQENLKRMSGLAGASGAEGSTGTALKSSGPSASYAGRIRASIKPNIVFTESVAGNPKAEVEVRTAPNGSIIGHKLLQSSGVKSWDEAVLKALDKVGTLPRDVDGRVPPSLIISFTPKD
jgi:colicin import membrane protein